jgi:hypothetical protein
MIEEQAAHEDWPQETATVGDVKHLKVISRFGPESAEPSCASG